MYILSIKTKILALIQLETLTCGHHRAFITKINNKQSPHTHTHTHRYRLATLTHTHTHTHTHPNTHTHRYRLATWTRCRPESMFGSCVVWNKWPLHSSQTHITSRQNSSVICSRQNNIVCLDPVVLSSWPPVSLSLKSSPKQSAHLPPHSQLTPYR